MVSLAKFMIKIVILIYLLRKVKTLWSLILWIVKANTENEKNIEKEIKKGMNVLRGLRKKLVKLKEENGTSFDSEIDPILKAIDKELCKSRKRPIDSGISSFYWYLLSRVKAIKYKWG